MSAGIINYNQRITISSRSGALAPHPTRREKAPDFQASPGAALSEPEVLFPPQFHKVRQPPAAGLTGPRPLPTRVPATPRGRRPGGAAALLRLLPTRRCPRCRRRMCLATPPRPWIPLPLRWRCRRSRLQAPRRLESMAGTRWVLGALLRGCGCNCSGCRPPAPPACPLLLDRRLLSLRGLGPPPPAAAARGRRDAASQTRGFQSGPVTAGLAGPPTAAASAARAAAASYPALRAPLCCHQSLAAAAASPARGYSQVRGCREGPRRTLPSRAPAPLGVRLAGARGFRGTRRTPFAPTPPRPVLYWAPRTRDAFPGLGFSCFLFSLRVCGRLGSVSVTGVNVEALFPAGLVGFVRRSPSPHRASLSLPAPGREVGEAGPPEGRDFVSPEH